MLKYVADFVQLYHCEGIVIDISDTLDVHAFLYKQRFISTQPQCC